jgi:tetratricopeptide (TPR) repeat protein
MNRFLLIILLPLFILSPISNKFAGIDRDGPKRGGGNKGLKGYEKEWKSLFEDSVEYYNYREFNNALKGFRRLLVRDRNNCNINFYTGMCLYYMRTPSFQVIPFLEKAVKKVSPNYSYNFKESAAPVFAWLYLGEMYLLNYKFNEAIQAFQSFKTYLTDRNRDAQYLAEVEAYLRYSMNAKKHHANPLTNVDIKSFSVVNTDYSEFTPFLTADGSRLYFASDRRGSTGGTYVPDYFKTDIYYLTEKDGRWIRPKKMGYKVNSSSFEFVGSYSEGGRTFVFSREDKREKDYNLYECKLNERGRFQFPELMNANINTKSNETGGFVSANGKLLFFVSDKPGGYGGKDIYYCELLSDGTWGRAYNLGPSINTEFDENFPFLMDDGVTLYFSSKGHDSMGGYDIFIATRDEFGFWSDAENMGYPINTPADDTGFIMLPDEKKAYYSTARNAHKSAHTNRYDIYEITFK